jgi:hypothetical protein
MIVTSLLPSVSARDACLPCGRPVGACDQHLERGSNNAAGDRPELCRRESGDQRNDRLDGEGGGRRWRHCHYDLSRTIKSARLEEGFRAAGEARGIAPRAAPWDDIQRGVLPLFADVPLGRVGELNELADAVAFLASPLAGYITGVNLHVDGGLSSLP